MSDDTYDDYSHTLGHDAASYETFAPKAKRAPRTYTITLLRRGAKRDHYRLDLPSVSGDPVNLGHHRATGNLSCGTCHTANLCTHVAALREWLDDQAKVAA